MKNLKIFIYVNFALGAFFSLTCIPTHLDISLLALPTAAAFTVVIACFVFNELFKKNSILKLSTVRRFFQYEPFAYITAFVLQRSGKSGVPYPLDLTAAILWTLVTISSFVILYKLSEKRVYTYSSDWEKEHKAHPVKKAHGLERVKIETLEWIDALIQAVFTIVLLNIFLFQLYEIPSESMVPEFLIKDRVIVFKTLAGPKFPMSDVSLPYIQKYDRGDIVVFRNPHYKDDRKSEVKSFWSQFVYMLTLTLVNINRDENGELKADPLVKRVTGLPGEQLMMMDGTLYARTASSPEFVPVKADSEWAAWNLNELPASTKKQIQTFPISQENAQVTLDVENERRNLDLVSAALECKSLSADFRRYARGKDIGLENVKKLFSERDFYVMSLFSSLDKNLSVLMKDDGGAEWVEHFLTDWYMNLGGVSALNGLTEEGSVTGSHLVGGDLYTDSLFRLNVMCKLAYGRILVENAKLISGNASASEILNDSVIRENYRKAQQLAMYLAYMDQRNMPLFPANNEDGSANYLPANSYFMMGDNRYNSLDMRHSYESNYKALYSSDDFSVTYYSNMEPQAVNRSRMLGKASYRFWPVSRAGVPGKGIRK